MNSAFVCNKHHHEIEPSVAFCFAFPKKTTPAIMIMMNAHFMKGLLSKNAANHFSSTIIFAAV